MSDKVRSELLKIHKRDSGITPQAVVQAARSEKSPLHSHFEWDDTVAGEKFRLDQARQLIRCEVTHVVGLDNLPRNVRAFVSVRPNEEAEQRYIPEEEARLNPFTRALVLQQMRSDIAALTRRYEHLSEYWDMVREMVGETA